MPISECTKIVGTKHTILPESGLFIKYIDLKNILEQYCNNNKKDINNLFDMGKYEGDPELFSTTKFLMKISVRSNGVSIPHVDFEKKAHPNSKLIPITNGVYVERWQSKELRNINSITNEELANIRKRLRSVMIDFVKERTGITLNKNICTLVWARRFAMYKRPYLLFSDEERIMNILLNKHYPMQIILFIILSNFQDKHL
jgi:glucan phosphorylase